MTEGALSGLKVLEYSEFIAGPYCTKLLADLGAEVIKMERPGFGDKARSFGPFPQDIPHPEKSGLFLFLNTNKIGITLNLETATGVKIFREMAKQVDIIVEDRAPQEVERLGLNYESLHNINSRLVVTSITPFGQEGPYRDFKACNLVSLCVSGLAYTNPATGVGDIEREPPLKLPMHVADYRVGLISAICTMFAVITRQATAVGQHVDLSQQEALALQAYGEVAQYTCEGFAYSRRQGGRPTGSTVYPTKDGYIFLNTGTNAFWAALMNMMGNPSWAQEGWCQDQNLRRQNWDALELLITEWTKQHTTEEVEQAAITERVPCSAVQSVKDAVNSEQLGAREFFVDIDHREAGRLKYPGAPFKFSATPWRVERPAPLLGEHNEQVYRSMLGYTRQDLVKLRQAGVI